jgi:predicted ATPase
MLTELHLSNFKSWRELDMKLGRVTGLFGTNSSGKSSILQFLLMLKQTKDATDRGLVLDLGSQNQLVNLGSFKDLIYQHQENLSLKWSIEWVNDDYSEEIFNNSVEVILKEKEMKVRLLELLCLKRYSDYKKLHKYKLEEDKAEYKSEECISEPENNTPIDQLNKIDIDKYSKKPPAPFSENSHYPPTKTYLFPNGRFKECTIFIELAYEKLMDNIYYLAPLREYPKREYQWSGVSPSDVGIRGEYAINAILAATIRNETRKLPNSNEEKQFQEVIAYWLKELGLIHEFSVKEIAVGRGLYDVIVKKSPESPATFLTDVGFGVSQVLPALVLLYYVPEGSIILMEQPEIHLHPAVQSRLADVILQVSKQRNLQVIVESHSEHLLQRFQRRVAEESYAVDELKLYFCDIQQGESKLIDLEMDEFGDIRNYPDNFFGDEMAEIAATHKAALKRKIQAQAK